MAYLYEHAAVVRLIDGDTVVLDIDLGNHLVWRDSFRLYGLNTPERGKPGASEATAALAALLAPGLVRVQTHKPDKYGRWLVDLWVAAGHVNQLLIAGGHAKPYSGHGPRT